MTLRDINRLLVVFYVVTAGFAFGSIYAAEVSRDADWLSRGGNMVVAASMGLTLAQFVFESRHGGNAARAAQRADHDLRSRDGSGDREKILATVRQQSQARFDAGRRLIFMNALGAAVFGEIFSAFGPLVYRHWRLFGDG